MNACVLATKMAIRMDAIRTNGRQSSICQLSPTKRSQTKIAIEKDILEESSKHTNDKMDRKTINKTLIVLQRIVLFSDHFQQYDQQTNNNEYSIQILDFYDE